jgi:hypothetical protein
MRNKKCNIFDKCIIENKSKDNTNQMRSDNIQTVSCDPKSLRCHTQNTHNL